MNQQTSPDRFENHILLALPEAEAAVLRPHLQRITVRAREVIQPAGEVVANVYFVESGMVSLVTILEDGTAVEVAAIGKAGMVGSELITGDHVSFIQALGQIEGQALRLPRQRFMEALPRCPTLLAHATHFRELLYAIAAQSAACGQSHEINRRLARWLLNVADQVGSDSFRLTQEFMAEMLAVQRPTVTIAARTLQATGAIAYRRGRVAILDRPALEEMACGCYQTLRRQYGRMAG